MRIATIVLILAAVPCLAGDLASFNFEGTRLGDTVKMFQQRHPEAKSQKVRPLFDAPPLVLHKVAVFQTGTGSARFTFYNGRLFRIALTYSQDTVNSLGGVVALHRKLEDRFGQTRNSIWREGDLYLGGHIPSGGGWYMVIEDEAVMARMDRHNERQAKQQTDPGF